MNKKGKYSTEFKEQAVKRTLSGSFTIKEVAESLGISYFVLRQWRTENLKKSEQQSPPTDKQLKESEELKKLRKENLKLKEENAILKKFAAMLSREQNPD
ncbi:transposase [Leptospira noguchii str. 2006001870]|nr:transposase [Leptospira noguchii str. 2006001870]